ncbi:uncharacterized protein [Rhodnius prolixus]|uniref:C2h2-type zn-finger protein n=1 Tax=Rhodnius prolixus TaxID=13249 RepID=T1HGS8_RHOPR
MRLVVKNSLGQVVSLQIKPDETFVDLKERVEEEAGISFDLRDIASRGKAIIDTQKVVDYFLNQNEPAQQNVVCSVPNCSNSKAKNPDKVFFNFPQEEIRCHQWVLYCQRLSMLSGKHRLNLTSESAICSDHFREDHFVKNTTTILKRTAVPCINPELPVVEAPPSYNKRHRTIVKKEPSRDVTVPMVCRLCAQYCTDCIFIFDEIGKQLRLSNKINSCLPIKVTMTDHLPKQVCRECIRQLNKIYLLAETCSNADTKLKKMVKEDMLSSRNVEAVNEEPESVEQIYCQNCPLCFEGKMCEPDVQLEEKQEEQANEVDQSSPSHHQINLKFDLEAIGCEDSDVESDEETFYKCKICSQIFTSFSILLTHSFSHRESDFYKCSICTNDFVSPNHLKEHMDEHKAAKVEEGECSCDICEKTFKSAIAFRAHSCEKNSILTSKCKICHKSFRTESRLEFHMKFHSGATPGYCDICRKSFPDEIKLYKHTAYLHAADKSYCCDECGKVFKSQSSLKYHQRSHQGESVMQPYSCEWCRKCFIRKSMLRNHIASAHQHMAQEASCFTCKICNEAFPSTNLAVAHMDAQHREECMELPSYSFEMHTITRLYTCEYCERYFAEGNALNKHREMHPQDSPYQCKICGKCFSSFGEQNDHRLTHTDQELPAEYVGEFPIPAAYFCEYCERCFMNYIKFSEHLTIHYGIEPYHCRFCELRFATLAEATEHRLTHVESLEPADDFNLFKPYECHYCSKSFAIEDALVKHIRMHTGEKPFICDQCGKGFSQSSGLYTHQKVHSNERPYNCPICPRTFKIKGDRDVHVRKHSGDRPYKCEFCGKAFMTQHVYSQHRKIHTGERPYKCDVCGIAFRRSHVLTVHKRIHTGEKPNVCDICGKSYRQKGDMLKHRRIKHGFGSAMNSTTRQMTNAEVSEELLLVRGYI